VLRQDNSAVVFRSEPAVAYLLAVRRGTFARLSLHVRLILHYEASKLRRRLQHKKKVKRQVMEPFSNLLNILMVCFKIERDNHLVRSHCGLGTKIAPVSWQMSIPARDGRPYPTTLYPAPGRDAFFYHASYLARLICNKPTRRCYVNEPTHRCW